MRDPLEGLPQAHVVREDAPLAGEVAKAHDALEHELDALALVWAEKSDERLIHRHGRKALALRELGRVLPQNQGLDAGG